MNVPVDHRRLLTILVTDLSGSTRLSGRLEPEEYQDLLNALRAGFDRVAEVHGGDIVRIDGDGALIVFGRDGKIDDSGRRATEAALDLHAVAEQLGRNPGKLAGAVRMHSGIHSGLVLLLPGDVVRGRWEILGEATNVAVRLCDVAAPGEILVSESTLGADRMFFRTGVSRLVVPPGIGVALTAHPVQGREETPSRFDARVRRGIAPFTGRDAELARLDALALSTHDGPPLVVALAGPAGIGKSRLASEFLAQAHARGDATHRSYCEAYLGARPMQSFAQLVRSLFARLPESALPANDDAPLRQLMADGGDGENVPRPEAIAPALVALVNERARLQPVILWIDDWQWADDASRMLLTRLAAGARGPVLILLTTRETDPTLAELSDVETIELAGLTDRQAILAISALLDAPEPTLVKRIARDAGGNPLFIEELCHAPPTGDNFTGRGDPHAWLAILIQARFRSLPDRLADLIKTAAVIGHVVPNWLFAAITGITPEDPALRDLEAADFLYPGEFEGTLQFKHGITRDAIYNIVGLATRKLLHAHVVEALDQYRLTGGAADLLELLAYHCGASDQWPRAFGYAMAAGDRAMAAAALDRAQAQYRAAFTAIAACTELPDRAREIARMVRRYGLSCVVDPAPDQIEVLEAMAELARSARADDALALADYWIGTIHYGLGQPRQAIARLESALRAAEALDSFNLAEHARAALGEAHLAAANCAEAADHLDAALPALRRLRTQGPPTGLAYALCCRGFLIADEGRFAEAEPYYREALAVLGDEEPPMRGSYLTQVAAIALWRGEYDKAIQVAERGIRHAERTRTRYNAMMSRALGAQARWYRDRDPAAIDTLVRATSWFLSGASRQRTSILFGWLAHTMVESGQDENARLYAAHALRRAREGDRLGEAMAYRAVARVAAAAGRRDPERYLALADRAAHVRASPRELAHNLLCAALVAHARGDAGRAAATAAEAEAAFAALGLDHHRDRAAAFRATISSR